MKISLKSGQIKEIPVTQERKGQVHDIVASLKKYGKVRLSELALVHISIVREDGRVHREMDMYSVAFGAIGLPVGTHKIVIENRDKEKSAVVDLKVESS